MDARGRDLIDCIDKQLREGTRDSCWKALFHSVTLPLHGNVFPLSLQITRRALRRTAGGLLVESPLLWCLLFPTRVFGHQAGSVVGCARVFCWFLFAMMDGLNYVSPVSPAKWVSLQWNSHVHDRFVSCYGLY